MVIFHHKRKGAHQKKGTTVIRKKVIKGIGYQQILWSANAKKTTVYNRVRAHMATLSTQIHMYCNKLMHHIHILGGIY